jgi:hypothetical protein
MLRKLIAGSAILSILAVTAAFTVTADEQADVIRSNGILWFDANGATVFVPEADVQRVVTNNPRGNVNVRIHGTLPAGTALPDRAMQFTTESTGFTCFGVEFKGVTTPSGQFSVTCRGP